MTLAVAVAVAVVEADPGLSRLSPMDLALVCMTSSLVDGGLISILHAIVLAICVVPA